MKSEMPDIDEHKSDNGDSVEANNSRLPTTPVVIETDASAAPRFIFTGMQAVAIFEGVKAVSILVVGFGLLSLINHDVEKSAAYLVKHLHLNPAHRYPRIFIEAARYVTNTNLWLLASLALFDAVIRGIEAVGLWHERNWAKWLGVVSAAIYLPIEIYEMSIHLTWLKTAMFVTNVVIVIYLGAMLRRGHR